MSLKAIWASNGAGHNLTPRNGSFVNAWSKRWAAVVILAPS
jgi:hypothetical protein